MPDQPRYAPNVDGTAGTQLALLTILCLPRSDQGLSLSAECPAACLGE